MVQMGMFAEEARLEKLSKLGDTLERLDVINWELFRPTLETAIPRADRSKGGRPSFDSILMFRILVLERLYNLADDQTEFQINDRRSFARFLGLSASDRVPDAKTIWLFRDLLTKAGVIEELFRLFNEQLEENGLISHAGTLIDATFVDAPRQRNSREENKKIKEGETPEEWRNNPHKLAQKDVDARWTKKRKETHYGYKDHVKVDADSKLITEYAVTPANVHDSNEFEGFLGADDHLVYADSAYVGKPVPEHVDAQICEKGHRGHPLTEEQKQNNRKKSKIRARVEHVFGFMTGSMHGITFRGVGLARASFNIGLTNLVYNLCRYSILLRREVKKA